MNKAADVYKNLNGIICVYKPAETSCEYVKRKIIKNLCKGLNQLETRPTGKIWDIGYDGEELKVSTVPDYADSTLCVGPRHQPEDFTVTFPSTLGDKVSGVLVAGINKGNKIAKAIERCFFPRCYHIKGILGQATEKFYISDKVIAKAKFSHVNLLHLNKILSHYQSVAQRRLFQEYGFDSSTQEAYELAISGLYRPREILTPILYNLAIVEFKPPDFTLEVQCINEDETFLLNLIHNIGMSLKCYATCVNLRCIRHGCFTPDHALLIKYWKVDFIPDNMNLCFDLLQKKFSQVLSFKSTLQCQSDQKNEINN